MFLHGKAPYTNKYRFLGRVEVGLEHSTMGSGAHQHNLNVRIDMQQAPGEVAEQVAIQRALVDFVDHQVGETRERLHAVGQQTH